MKANKLIRKSLAETKKVMPPTKCVACSGSGYYDTQINGKTPKCGSCGGTGLEEVTTPLTIDEEWFGGDFYGPDGKIKSVTTTFKRKI
jgi:hypothetical protein